MRWSHTFLSFSTTPTATRTKQRNRYHEQQNHKIEKSYFFFDNGGRPTPRVGTRSTFTAFVGTLCAHRPLLGSSLFPKTFNIDLFINTNCQTSLLPGPSPTPQSRHLRSPGAQLRHSIITALLGSLTPKIRWREPPGGLELSAQPKISPSPRARRPHHFSPRFNIHP